MAAAFLPLRYIHINRIPSRTTLTTPTPTPTPTAAPVLSFVSFPASLLAALVGVDTEAEVEKLVLGVVDVDGDDEEEVALDDAVEVVWAKTDVQYPAMQEFHFAHLGGGTLYETLTRCGSRSV